MNNDFLRLLDIVEEEIEDIETTEILYNPNENRVEEYDQVFDFFLEKDIFLKSTNFSKIIILELYLLFSQFFSQIKMRGKKLKYTIMDHFLVLLTFYKTGVTIEVLGDLLRIDYYNMRAMIKRSRIVLNNMLVSKWNEEMPRFNPSLQLDIQSTVL